jgi:hypothetical protein
MFNARTILAAVLGGISGTIANSIAITLAIGAPLLPLIFSFGREAVAILVALLLIPIFTRLSGTTAWLVALVVLTLVPSILAKVVFGATVPLIMVLAFNAIYALVATVVYVLVTRQSARV